jgi:hypothetical protein
MEGILKKVIEGDKNQRWSVKLDGPEIAIVREHLDMMESEKDATIMSAARILGNCSNPLDIPKRRVGLAIGKVQSGKTSNYISLTALALDNNIRIVIVFGGASKILLRQTNDRIVDNFNLVERNGSDDRSLSLLSTSNNFDNLSPKNVSDFYMSGKKIIITALKSYTHINKITSMLKLAGLDLEPILIIDDEGDQMTLNGAVKKGKQTTTYRDFVNLFSCLKFSTFISVTATPEANLLISIEDELSPDFCELIIPGSSYSGAEVFHNQKYTKYICEVPINENVILDQNEGIPESFEKALSTFFVGSVVRELRGDFSTHSMLIHPSSRIIDHKVVDVKVNDLLDKYKDYATSKEKYIIEFFEKFVRLGYDEISKTIPENFDFFEIVDLVRKTIYDTRVVIVNGDNETEISYNYVKNYIVIGGTMVERGLTVKKLAVTYIVRSAKGKENADTVLQRCRWFGYRMSKGRSYLDLCRVFMTDSMADNFYNLKLTEESIWNCIRYSEKNGIKLKEMDRIFEISDHFNPTRSNVVPDLQRFNFGKFSSQRSIIGMHTQDKIVEIQQEWAGVLANYESELESYPNFDHLVYKNVDFNLVFNKIIEKYYKDEKIRFDYKYLKAVYEWLNISNKPLLIDIYVMRHNLKNGGHGEEHNIFEDGTIGNIMQGQNEIEGDPKYYPGDHHLKSKGVQIQIHNVKNAVWNLIDIPVISFYAPEYTRMVGRIL